MITKQRFEHGKTIFISKPIGSVYQTKNGYIQTKTESGWIMQHRYVMEQKLGRKLLKEERVHHKNANRADNRPENLELWTINHKDPAGARVIDKIIDKIQSNNSFTILSKEEQEKLLTIIKQVQL